MGAKKTDPCSICGTLMWPAPKTAAPARVCLPCRRAAGGVPYGQRVFLPDQRCTECGETFTPVTGSQSRPRKFCSLPCSNRYHARNRVGIPQPTPKGRGVPNEWTARTTRKFRERVAPGLAPCQRKALMSRWIKQGRTCAYCDKAPTTIDHIVPISRGGTNHEGNLAPSCKPCNSSKCDLLLSEWKHNRPHGLTVTMRPWMIVRARRERYAAA